MKFVPLSRVILLALKRKGYNILTSKNTVDNENPTWYPLTVPDVDDYLLHLDCSGSIVPMEEQALLVIDDVLNNIEEGQLLGEVFLQIDHLGELEDKIQFYRKQYKLISNPEYYVFSFDPKRVLIRNYALRTGNHLLYLAYIDVNYPTHIIDEMRDLEDLTRSLICLDQEQAREWFSIHDVAMVESDISIYDKVAIITIFALGKDQHFMNALYDNEDLIYNLMHTADILILRDVFWIDPRIK